MSFIAPLLGRIAGSSAGVEAAEALTAGRNTSFSDGAQGVSPGGLLGLNANRMPVIAPQKAGIDDVEGNARRTTNPNTVLR